MSALTIEDFDRTLVDKAQTCLYDLIGCALESVDKPWSRQAMARAAPLKAGQPGADDISLRHQPKTPWRSTSDISRDFGSDTRRRGAAKPCASLADRICE